MALLTPPFRILILIVATLACARADQRDNQAAVIDNVREGWTPQTAWRIETQPTVAIGTVDGPAEYQMFRVLAALKLPDNSIVVANSGSGQIRFYDSRGVYLRSVGREGAGPGEYRFIRNLFRFGSDSLLVWDNGLHRGTVLSNAGTYARTITGPSVGGMPFYVGVMADRSLLGFRLGGRRDVVQPVAQNKTTVGVRTDSAWVFRFTPTGEVREIGTFFAGESYAASNGTVRSMPFGRLAVYAVAGDMIYYGSADAFELRGFQSEGHLERVIRVQRPNSPLTRDIIAKFVDDRLAKIKDPSSREQSRIFYADVSYPRTIPAYSDLIVDALGNLWVGDYHPVGEAGTEWTVLNSEGTLLGRITMPAKLTVLDVGTDYVIGRIVDDFGVERLVSYRLIKPT